MEGEGDGIFRVAGGGQFGIVGDESHKEGVGLGEEADGVEGIFTQIAAVLHLHGFLGETAGGVAIPAVHARNGECHFPQRAEAFAAVAGDLGTSYTVGMISVKTTVLNPLLALERDFQSLTGPSCETRKDPNDWKG